MPFIRWRGDEDESAGTHEARPGAVPSAVGGVGAGTLAGVATMPVLGPVGCWALPQLPIDWSELDMLAHSAQWTIANIDARLAAGNSLWDACPASIHSLTGAMKLLGYAPKKT